MRFRPGEGPSRGLLCDCEIFGYLRIITFVSSSILDTQQRFSDIITILLTVDIFCCEVVTVLFTALSSATRSAALHTSLKADKIRGGKYWMKEERKGFVSKSKDSLMVSLGFIEYLSTKVWNPVSTFVKIGCLYFLILNVLASAVHILKLERYRED